MDEIPEAASSDAPPDEQAETPKAPDTRLGTTPVEPTPDAPDDPDEVLASIRRLHRLEREKSRIPAGTSRFDAIVRTLDEAARELFRRAAGAVDASRGSEPDTPIRTPSEASSDDDGRRRPNEPPDRGANGAGTDDRGT